MVPSATAPSAATAVQIRICKSRFTVSLFYDSKLRNGREFQKRIDLAKYFGQLFRETRICRLSGLHFPAHDPALDFLPVLRADGPALVLRPIPFFGSVPIAVEFPAKAPLLAGDPLWFCGDARLRNERQRGF